MLIQMRDLGRPVDASEALLMGSLELVPCLFALGQDVWAGLCGPGNW